MDQDQKMDNYQTIQGVSTRYSQETISSIDFMVTGLNQGVASMNVQFKKLFLSASSDNQKMVINTAGTDNDKINNLFKQIIGKTFSLTLESNGTIDSISGLELIISTLEQGVSDTNNADEIALKSLLESQISPQAIRSGLQLVLPYYPDRNLNTGDHWQNNNTVTGPPAGNMNNDWSLEYGDKYSIRLDYNGSFSTADPNQIIPLGGGFEGKISLSGTIVGNYSIDPQTDWPSIGIQHTEYEGVYHYRADQKLKLKTGLDVPVRIVSDNEIKILHL